MKPIPKRLHIVGVAVPLLLALGAGAPAQPGGRQGRIEWSPERLEMTVIRGTNQGAILTVRADREIQGIRLRVVPALEPLLLVSSGGRDTLPQGEAVVFAAQFQVADDTPLGQYQGTVQVRTGESRNGQNVARPLPVILQVVEASADLIPTGPADPSPDRIIEDENGQRWIKDEVVVVLDLDTEDPDSRAQEIATATGGVFLGSVPETYTYQIQYEVASDAELQATIDTIAGFLDVTAAVRNFIADPPVAIPDDTEYTDPWIEATPAGDNYHFEMVRAITAWNTTTGSNAVTVGVIDGEIDDTHEDLDDNMSIRQLSGAGGSCGSWGGHGSHVAGIVGAEGDNAQGVTGMNWDVNLHGYDFSDSSCTTTVAQSMMVDAVNDGVDIVNMSLQWINNNQCGTAGTNATLTQVAQANAVLGQGILWAQRQGQDVLWVFAAGNECRDTIYASPASLVDLYPRNTLAVANVEDTGALRASSNFGCLVSVAAPGTGILSTVPTDAYGWKTGTSMAAPLVAGLAALLKADDSTRTAQDIRTCIVANANAFGNAVAGHDFFVVDAPAALACTATVVLPPKVDLVISIDSSGSMGGELALLKANINTALSDLVSAAPGTDFQFGVVSYEDYPDTYSSLACGSTYSAEYGTTGKPDSPFRIEQAMTDVLTTVQTAVNGVTLGYGADAPQSYGRVYWELAQADTAATMGFRSDALRIVLDFGDDVPHDADLNENILTPPFATFDRGFDPGRNNTIDCGGDDIDFQDDALDALSTNDIRLVHVDSSENPDLVPYWQSWVGQTGGAFETINSDGSIPAGKSLSQLIIDLLQAIPPCS